MRATGPWKTTSSTTTMTVLVGMVTATMMNTGMTGGASTITTCQDGTETATMMSGIMTGGASMTLRWLTTSSTTTTMTPTFHWLEMTTNANSTTMELGTASAGLMKDTGGAPVKMRNTNAVLITGPKKTTSSTTTIETPMMKTEKTTGKSGMMTSRPCPRSRRLHSTRREESRNSCEWRLRTCCC